MSRARVLRSEPHDAELELEGYTVVRDALSPDDVAALRRVYEEVTPPGDHGLAIDYMRPDREVMRAVARSTGELARRLAARVAPRHRVAMTTFVTKHPGPESAMFLHDDRNFAEPDAGPSLTFWIPLVDATADAGCGTLEVVPGSHRLRRGLSGTGTPDAVRPHEDALRSLLCPVDAPAGTVVVYDGMTLHASSPNRTDRPRVALVCALVPAAAPLIHVVAAGDRRRLVYEVDEQFFLDVHPVDIARTLAAQGTVRAELFEDTSLDEDALASLIGERPPPVRSS